MKNFLLRQKEDKDGEKRILRKKIKDLEGEIARLKKQLRTYDKFFDETNKFVKGLVHDISLEDLLDEVENKKKKRKKSFSK